MKRFVVSTDGEVGDGRRSKGLVDAPSSRCLYLSALNDYGTPPHHGVHVASPQ